MEYQDHKDNALFNGHLFVLGLFVAGLVFGNVVACISALSCWSVAYLSGHDEVLRKPKLYQFAYATIVANGIIGYAAITMEILG